MEKDLTRQPYDEDPDYISKSSFKRESKQAQDLGCSLAKLSQKQLDSLDLNEQLYDAINTLKKIKINTEASRRQMQLIGRLTRECSQDVKDKIKEMQLNSNYDVVKFKLTKIIEELFADPDIKIQSLIETNSQIDRQKLRQLVRKAQKSEDLSELSSYLHKAMF